MSNQINEGAARYSAEKHDQSRPELSGTQGTQSPQQLVTDHLDLWTSTVTPKSTSGRGRGSGKSSKLELTGIKKLRELILELAVRGKLVAQNPDDEPASKLLERIEAEKAQLIKDGKLKKQKPLAAVSEDEKPFVLPEGWEWTRLGNLGNTQTGGTPAKGKAEYFNGDIPFVKPGDIDQGILKNSSEFLSEAGLNALGREVPKGSILMVCIGTIGKCAISRERCSFNQQINSITPFLPMEDYLLAGLSSSYFQEMAWSNSSSTTISILNKGKWGNICVPLPPLAEQQRIVTKVDELMALCDQLEQQSEHQLTAHQQLTDTLLATLTESANAHELHDNWQRLAQQFDLLFSGPMGAWAIDRLKDTVLQLAVMGKLVPQNPDDEPASALLKRIEEEKARLVKEGKIKKPKKLPLVSDDEKPFKLPEGWECIRLGNIVAKLGSGSTPRGGKSAYVSSGIPFLRSQNVWNEGLVIDDIAFITQATHENMSNTVVYPGDILLNITGASLGRSIIFPDTYSEANVSQHVTIIRLLDAGMTAFMVLCIKSPFVQRLVWGRQVGMAIEGLSKKVLECFEMPIPPLPEQQRIVAKVDELFTLCDQLKDRLQQASETEQHLTNAIVEQALS